MSGVRSAAEPGSPPLPGVVRGAAGYEERRRRSVWQRIVPDRLPAALVEVADQQEAVDTVLAARRAGRRVSVISSGHSYIGDGLQDGTVLLDLRRFIRIDIDSAGETARIGPAVTNGRLDAALAAVDRAFPIGHSPSVAVGGYLLGGGLGWNPDGWGVTACARVTGATVLLASGERVRTSSDEHPDLFFALRGAGPCFPGAVLDLEVRLAPRPRSITEVAVDLPLDAAGAVAEAMTGILRDKGAGVELSVLLHSPDGVGGATITVTAVAFDAHPSAQEPLAPLLAHLPSGASPRRAQRTLASMMADNDAPPQRYAVDGAWSDDPVDVLRRCAERFRSCPSPDSLIHVSLRSRAALPAGLAFSVAGSTFVFASAVWDAVQDDPANLTWLDGLVDDLRPVATGHYVNETDYIRHPERLRACFSAAAWERIERVQRQYDPGNVFAAPNRPG